MNPWAFLVILLGIMVVIVGVKGSQHNIASAITGKGTPVKVPATGNPAPASAAKPTVPASPVVQLA